MYLRRLIAALITFGAFFLVPVVFDTVEPMVLVIVLLIILGTLMIDLVLEAIIHK